RKNKEEWVNDTIESAGFLNRAEANPFMYSKILSRIKSGEKLKEIIPLRKAAFAFLSILLLIALNYSTIMYSIVPKNSSIQTNTASEVIPSQQNPYLEILSK
ncbi:MAG: hypothetical protein IT281_08530, partial [Ignavibacteria bacterium]|nr:hypothetical protein [Ignavibacteria bacterium]